MSFLFGNRSSKTFKPKKNIPEGSHQHELMKHAAATLGSGQLKVTFFKIAARNSRGRQKLCIQYGRHVRNIKRGRGHFELLLKKKIHDRFTNVLFSLSIGDAWSFITIEHFSVFLISFQSGLHKSES